MNKKTTMLVVGMLSLFALTSFSMLGASATQYKYLTSNSEIEVTHGFEYLGSTYDDTHDLWGNTYRGTYIYDSGYQAERLEFTVDFTYDVTLVKYLRICVFFPLGMASDINNDDVSYVIDVETQWGWETFSYYPDDYGYMLHTIYYANEQATIKSFTVNMFIDGNSWFPETSGIDFIRCDRIIN